MEYGGIVKAKYMMKAIKKKITFRTFKKYCKYYDSRWQYCGNKGSSSFGNYCFARYCSVWKKLT